MASTKASTSTVALADTPPPITILKTIVETTNTSHSTSTTKPSAPKPSPPSSSTHSKPSSTHSTTSSLYFVPILPESSTPLSTTPIPTPTSISFSLLPQPTPTPSTSSPTPSSSSSPTTPWTAPQRAGIIAATLLSVLILLTTLLSTIHIHRLRRKMISELERGPSDPRRGRRRDKSGSKSGSRSRSRDASTHLRGNNSRHSSNHHHHRHRPSGSNPWNWLLKMRAARKRGWGDTATAGGAVKQRRIAGLEDVKPGPAILRSLFESGVGIGFDGAVGVAGDGDGDGDDDEGEGEIKGEEHEMSGGITRRAGGG